MVSNTVFRLPLAKRKLLYLIFGLSVKSGNDEQETEVSEIRAQNANTLSKAIFQEVFITVCIVM